MKSISQSLRLFSLLALLLTLSGCGGYSVGGGDTSVLPAEYRTIAIKEVTNPTTLSWLEPRVRELVRDEVTRRTELDWVEDPLKADATIKILIKRYHRPTAVTGTSDETLSSNAIFSFEGIIHSSVDDRKLWHSGLITLQWPFFTGDEAKADEEVTRLGIRKLVDRMTQNY